MIHPKNFRSDIEGLRAVAIFLVIAAHFAIYGFSGGFIGVDVFFVISGYLITSILVKEYQNHHSINFARFYANRLRRLLPALAVMLIISSIVALKLLPDIVNLAYSKSAASAIFWLSNIYFTFADVNYFEAETNTNLFLHTWSLGVEEQFYLVWPLLILLSLRFLSKTQNNKAQDKILFILFLIIACLSITGCFVLVKHWATFSFYMMPTRAWQFSAGALTWLITNQKAVTVKGSNIAGIVGATLLVTGLCAISPLTLYPSWLALLPTVATCALIYSGSCQQSTSYRSFSITPMQWLGKLSYSWYLWHWPVLILGEHFFPIRGVFFNTVLAIIISLLLAIFTYYLIENPIRFGRIKQIQVWKQIGLAIFIMIMLNSLFLRWNIYSQKQITQNQNNVFILATRDMPSFYQNGCDTWYSSDELTPCSYGDINATKTAVLWGDSIGAQWFPALTSMYNSKEWKIIVLTKSSCPIVDEPFFYQRIGREYTECSRWRTKAITWLNHQKIDTLFIGSVASTPFTDEQWTQGTLRILDQLQTVPNIYLIESNPTLGYDGPECLMKYYHTHPEKCIGSHTDNQHYRHVAQILRTATQQTKNTHWIEVSNFVCPQSTCRAMMGNTVVFRDPQHLTASFTAQADKYFLKQMEHNTPQ